MFFAEFKKFLCVFKIHFLKPPLCRYEYHILNVRILADQSVGVLRKSAVEFDNTVSEFAFRLYKMKVTSVMGLSAIFCARRAMEQAPAV